MYRTNACMTRCSFAIALSVMYRPVQARKPCRCLHAWSSCNYCNKLRGHIRAWQITHDLEMPRTALAALGADASA